MKTFKKTNNNLAVAINTLTTGFCAIVFMLVIECSVADAQSGLRKSLERLDANENGLIDPEEVTPLARPFLERIMQFRSRRNVSFDKPIPISRIQEYARIYHALKNGISGEDVRARDEATVKPFGADDNEPLVPEFGIGEMKFPYIQYDLDQAIRTISREDNNGDGYIDRREAARAKWTHRNPFDDDLDDDGRLSKMELAQRYARRRLLQGDTNELVRKSVRTGSEAKPSYKGSKDREKRDDSQWWRKGGSSTWLSASMMGRFDKDKNGSLNADEIAVIGLPLVALDIDRDGEVTREELHAHVTQLQDAAGEQTEGLPGWFYERDANKNDQIAMSEFADSWDAAKIKEFESYDLNSDGILTATEILRAASAVGGSFVNDEAMVLPPRKTIISEIEIDDSFTIADLKVRLSMTHTNVGSLDGFLTGPDGQRVELFTAVGGRDDHFEGTTFDDKAEAPITKARPPFKGSFRPEAMDKKQPSLGSFKGKNIKGVWQLVIRGTRNDRFGMLHNWAIVATPDEDGQSKPATGSPKKELTSDSGKPPVKDSSTPNSRKGTIEGKGIPRSPKSAPRTNGGKTIDAKKSGEKDPITGLIELFK